MADQAMAQRRSFKRWYLSATLPYAIFLSIGLPFVALEGDSALTSYVWVGASVFLLAACSVGLIAEAAARWLLVPFLAVFVLAFLGGGPSGFIFFAPAMALFLLLTARRSSFA
jgi:hypothetical protein